MPENIISFDDFAKLDLRVGKIIKVEEIKGADKLWKLKVDLGFEKRTICAGLKQYYSEEELLNKKIIVVVNLAPRKMCGIESQGMLLAAVSDDESAPKGVPPKVNVGGTVVLISPEKDIKVGAKVR